MQDRDSREGNAAIDSCNRVRSLVNEDVRHPTVLRTDLVAHTSAAHRDTAVRPISIATS
jgi:hypothetical protein